ncbi:sulfatase family protein [Pontiella sulfatireligans]|uniref:Arylsulfatase n=1 Tax=Pontiella sulfatireligans TaxID=2750658 RepID=A0A6C2UIS0_9BACT|nr:sulfatase [Pontiella sulfatireligans]SPS74399.1 sulfatase S1_11 [Kiritimatiellales bacterium]VGO20100.1 Arylsulfatase [Pontiella sulfatireligans]
MNVKRNVLMFMGVMLGSACWAMGAAPSRPNIVFIFSDDHATQAISAYGGMLANVAPTPNLDRIAEKGMLFTRCLVGNSICGPSRATILTGKHSHLNGFMVNEATVFDGSQQTFPKLLQKAGYQTAIIGKWHLGSDPTGFDYWEVLPGQGYYYSPDFDAPEGTHRETGYVTDIITWKAKKWLDEQRDPAKPFILMVQHKAPHREWSPAPKYLNAFDGTTMPEPDTLFDDYAGRGTAAREQDMSIEKTMELGKDLKIKEDDFNGQLADRIQKRMTPEQLKAWNAAYQPKNEAFLKANLKGKDLVRWKYQRYLKDYLRCIKSVDDSVGEIWNYLEQKGMLESTVFVYSSDQGFYLGEHGWFDKRFMYDESYRTPLLVSWPGVTKPGVVNSDLVSNLDFAETFLDIAGVEAPADMQGASLVPILGGMKPDDWRTTHYYHYYEYPGWHMVQRHEGVYDGRYKLINFYDLGEWELYDLQSDPKEMKNQHGNPEYAEVVKRMHKELDASRAQYEVPENQKKDLSNVDMHYHSEFVRKQAEKKK